MPAEAEGRKTVAGLKPFTLRWAEEAPESLLWSQQSVFSTPVNGLDSTMVGEPDHSETTSNGVDMVDSTHT